MFECFFMFESGQAIKNLCEKAPFEAYKCLRSQNVNIVSILIYTIEISSSVDDDHLQHKPVQQYAILCLC